MRAREAGAELATQIDVLGDCPGESKRFCPFTELP
jgi:hypothetical protein